MVFASLEAPRGVVEKWLSPTEKAQEGNTMFLSVLERQLPDLLENERQELVADVDDGLAAKVWYSEDLPRGLRDLATALWSLIDGGLQSVDKNNIALITTVGLEFLGQAHSYFAVDFDKMTPGDEAYEYTFGDMKLVSDMARELETVSQQLKKEVETLRDEDLTRG